MGASVSVEQVRSSVYAAIESFNADEVQQVARQDDCVLLGPGGAVDSLGLVRLVMVVERRIEDDFGTPISLTDERAMSQRNSPFRSVGTLVAYITTALNEAR